MSEFTIEFTEEFARKLAVAEIYDKRATPYIAEGMDRILFAFRRDRVLPAAAREFDNEGPLSEASKRFGIQGWRVARSTTAEHLRDLIGRLFIASKAAYAHEYGAMATPKKQFFAIPIKGSLVSTKSGKVNALGRKIKEKKPGEKLGGGKRTFTRVLKNGSIGVFLETGLNKSGKFRVGSVSKKTGKARAGAQTQLVFRLIRSFKVNPKLGIRREWAAYGAERERRLEEQLALFWSDFWAGKVHKRAQGKTKQEQATFNRALRRQFEGSVREYNPSADS